MPANPLHPSSVNPATASDPLAELRPLIEPAAISGWPLAPGWWVVAFTLLLIIIGLTVWAIKRRRYQHRTRYQREALALLDTLNTQDDTTKQLHNIALILRRAAVCAWGRERAGTAPWNEVLALSDKNITLNSDSIRLLTECLYQQQAPSSAGLTLLLSQSRSWLVQLPPVEN